MMPALSKNIISTIAYYDLLDYPLTGFEIWKYLLQNDGQENGEKSWSLGKISEELDREDLKKFVENHWGFYFLRGRKNLVEERLRRNKISSRKMKRARRIARILKFIPFVRLVALTGRVAMKNARPESDLDFFIVIEKGKMFTGRTLVTLATHLMGVRRHGNKIANRVCLNYYVATDSLEIVSKDIFSSSEYSFIFPLYGFEFFQEFQKNNLWIGNFHLHYQVDGVASLRLLEDSVFSRTVRKVGERLLDFQWLEKSLEKWQMEKIARNPKTSQAGSKVAANGKMLVFLPEPQGPEISERFGKRLEKLEDLWQN